MSHYSDWKYVDEQRFSSFYIQVNEALKFDPSSILEIGVGSGIVRDILRGRKNISVLTMDINPGLNPDIVGSVINLPLVSKSVDVITCCQVLEHLDFSFFTQSVKEFLRVARRGVVISVPDCEPYYRADLILPFINRLEFNITRNRMIPLSMKGMNPSHFWEIGRGGVRLQSIKELILSLDVSSLQNFRNKQYPYHHFFIVRAKM